MSTVSNRSIGRASSVLASGTIISRILGFIKTIVFTQIIGVQGYATDAFSAANQLPNTIYVVVAGGVLGAVLVPQIVRSAVHVDGGQRYINKLVTISLLILAATSLCATLLAPVLVKLVASGFSPEQNALATAFAYWCIPQIFFYGVYTILGEVLNARNSFGPFTWSPALNNIIALGGLVLFIVFYGTVPLGTETISWWSPDKIALLAGTTTLGIVVQALTLVTFWRRIGLKYRPDFGWRGVGLGSAGKMASWTFGMLCLTTIAGFVEVNVVSTASGQHASVTAVQTAWLIFMLPHSIIAVSIATAYFTRMSEHISRTEKQKFTQDLSQSIRIISTIMILATIILMITAYPFGRIFATSFTNLSNVGNVLLAFLFGLPAFSILFVLQRAFYAQGDTRTPFFITLFQTGVFSLGALCILVFVSPEFIAVAIAGMLSLAGILQTILATILLKRTLGKISGSTVKRSLAKSILAALPTSLIGILASIPLGTLNPSGFALTSIGGALISLAVLGVTMTATYLGMLALLRSAELNDALTLITRRLKKQN